jgi:hypothetical protein
LNKYVIIVHMQRFKIVILALCSFTMVFSLVAQEELLYEDHIYLEHIKSVQLSHQGLSTSLPLVDLGSSAKLKLSFDDILGGDREYTYRLIHCDKDWQPSELDESQYLDGFNDEEIRDYEYSIGTRIDFTNYTLELPNNDVNWRISGNFLLVVRDNDSDELAFSRRFMVAEKQVVVNVDIKRALLASKSLTHQELIIAINNRNFPVSNPQREIFVTAIQNGRWDIAQENIIPQFVIGDQIEFNRAKRISFPAFNEFRGVDIRSLRSRGFGVRNIEVKEDGIRMIVEKDRKRQGITYSNVSDLNGNYIIQSLEYNQDHIRSDYIETSFAIENRDIILDGDVYLIGKFTDWKPLEEFRLKYDYDLQLYYGGGLLKQGYYDYQYVVLYDDETYDPSYFEGSNFATDNDYVVLVYYRSLTGRYDRLIGVTSLISEF